VEAIGRTVRFPSVVVTAGRCGPDDYDSCADGAVPGRGSDDDGGGGGRGGSDVVPTAEEERDGVVPWHGGEGKADDMILECSDGVEAVGVVAASKKVQEILAA
jgi:hypothetical protein